MPSLSVLLVSGVLLLGAALGSRTILAEGQYHITENRLDALPYTLLGFTGTDERFTDSVYAVLANDHNLYRRYAAPDGRTIQLYIGYYGTAKGGRPSHVPQFCYTGQGYSIEAWENISRPDGRPNEFLNKMIVRRQQERQLVLFWLLGHENTIPKNGIELNLMRLGNRVLGARDDGSLIRVSMTIPPGEEQRTLQDLSAFSAELLRQLPKYWPVEARS